MTYSRRATTQQHVARPTPKRPAESPEEKNLSKNEEYYRMDYIDFINRLMQRMRMDGIKKMLDVALEQIDD